MFIIKPVYIIFTGDYMKKTFGILLSIFFALILLFVVNVQALNKNISYTDIFWIISDNGFIGKIEKIEDGLYHGNKEISLCNKSLEDKKIHSLIKQYAEDYEIDMSLVQQILDDKDIKTFTDKYIKEITQYMVGSTDSFDLDTEEVRQIISKGMDIYEMQTGIVYDRQQVEEVFEKEINSVKNNVIEKLDDARTDMNQNSELSGSILIIKKLFDLLSYRTLWILLVVELIIVLILIFITKTRSILYLGISGLTDGIIILLNCVLFFVKKSELSLMLSNALKSSEALFNMINGFYYSLLINGLLISFISILFIMVSKFIKTKKV